LIFVVHDPKAGRETGDMLRWERVKEGR
jgi:hypothetical protein